MSKKESKSGSISRRRLLATAGAGAALAASPLGANLLRAQAAPIKIGMSMPQTGGLAGGGKPSLLGIEIWRDDVNAKGGLLGRKVELVVYDDKSSASETPAIYSKLIDVDKVDLLFAPYATVPTAPIMPLVKQRGLLLIGNFSFQVNSKVGHDMWFNNAPWGPADSWATSFLDIGQKAGGKSIALLSADQEFAQNLVKTTREVAAKRNMPVVFDQAYPPSTVEFSSIIRAVKAAKPDIVYVASYPPDSAGILRAVNEIGIGDSVKLFGGGMVGLQFGTVMENHGFAAQRRRQLQFMAPREEHVFRRNQGVLREVHQARRRGEGRSARLLPGAVRLCQRPAGRGSHQRDEIARSKGTCQISAREHAQDHRRSDRVLRRRRAQGNRGAAGAVPRCRRQEHRAVPQLQASR